jgi:PPOX class probable F420-dependent enzyme
LLGSLDVETEALLGGHCHDQSFLPIKALIWFRVMIPESHADLLKEPRFVHLAAIGPDGAPHVQPIWTIWDGEFLRFTTTTDRQKCKNVLKDPRVSVSVNDPDAPYRYLEVRGVVERVEPDPEGEFFDVLGDRYGLRYDKPIGDHERRVILVMRPTHVTFQG